MPKALIITLIVFMCLFLGYCITLVSSKEKETPLQKRVRENQEKLEREKKGKL